MAIVIGVVGIFIGFTGIIISWIALTKVQTLSVQFVQAHIQGLRTEISKYSVTINSLTTKVAILEKKIIQADRANEDKITSNQASTH